MHKLKYEVRKRRHHPKEEAEIKLYQAINSDRYDSVWEIRHMQVFSNGTVAQFLCKRQKIVLWIDTEKDNIPAFPEYITVIIIPEHFILEKTIQELAEWVKDLMDKKATERIQQFIAGLAK